VGTTACVGGVSHDGTRGQRRYGLMTDGQSGRTSAVPGTRGRSSLRLWILLFHQIEHAAGRRSSRPIVDNVGDLARINFLRDVAWLRTIAVRRG
jgi:hypothetical protein